MTLSGSTEKKKKQAVTTVIQCRVPIFLPVKRLPIGEKGQDIVIETKWGKVTFKNAKLTQVHRNILDCIFTYYEKRHEYQDGCVGFLISLRQLQKRLGITPNHHAWLVEKLQELATTPMVIENKEKAWKIHTGIVRKFKYSTAKLNTKQRLFGDGHYFGVIFENEYMQIFKDDINVHSHQLTKEIISLGNAFLQAFVRFCLSHRKLNINIDDALKAIGVAGSDRYIRERKRDLKTNRDVLGEKFGIEITDTHVFYTQHPLISFKNPDDSDDSDLDQG